jgi:chromosome segregation ATPase
MLSVKVTSVGIVALAIIAGACNREVGESSTPSARQDAARDVDEKADLQRERDEEISRLDTRVAEIERDYADANQKVVSGERKATAGLREELKEDVTNVKTAVSDLRTTTPDNWWERHEEAMKRTADDIQADVVRLAGKVTSTSAQTPNGRTEENPSSAPFTSRRDRFVTDLRARVDAMEQALDTVRARGAQETELEDARARVKKLGEDVDRLRSASADDWWDVSKARVTEYVDRVEASVGRLDDNKS